MKGTTLPARLRGAVLRSSTGVLVISALVIALLAVLMPARNAAAADPPRPTLTVVGTWPLVVAPGQYEIAHQILEFAPGAATPEHKHGGQVFVTVLEGQITFRRGDAETVYSAGQTFSEPADDWGSATNKGAVKAKVFASFLLSPGATLTTNHPNKPLPATLPVASYLSRVLFGGQSGEYNLTQILVDFAPGTYLPLHTHGGAGITTVTEGEVAFGTSAGELRRGPGGIFVDAGIQHDARNAGAAPAKAIVTFLIPKGAAVTTFVTQPAAAPAVGAPSTGDGGLLAADDASQVLIPAVLILVAGVTISVMAWRWRPSQP